MARKEEAMVELEIETLARRRDRLEPLCLHFQQWVRKRHQKGVYKSLEEFYEWVAPYIKAS